MSDEGAGVRHRSGGGAGSGNTLGGGAAAGRSTLTQGMVVQRSPSSSATAGMMGAHPPPALHQDDPIVGGPGTGAAEDPFAVHQLPPASGGGAAPAVPRNAIVPHPQAVTWAATMSDVGALRQARLDVAAAPAGAPFQVGGQPVTIDEPTRRQIQDAIRRRVMARVVEVRAPLLPDLAAAHDGQARRAVQERMRAAARGFLDELRDRAQPPNRFESDERTQREVLAALELDGEGRAEVELRDQRDHGPDGPRARARAAARLHSGPWCGAFCYTQQHGAGLTDIARAALHSTHPTRLGAVDAMLEYRHEPHFVWDGAQWVPLETYHGERGSLRQFHRTPTTPTPITSGSVETPAGLDIQPGDVVLIDNIRGAGGDHITQCRSYDPTTGRLETIAGNERTNEGEIGTGSRDLNNNPAPFTAAEGVQKRERSRVYAWGRFSIVDYETHHYRRTMPADPHSEPPANAPGAHDEVA